MGAVLVVAAVLAAGAGEPIKIAAPGLRMVNLEPKQSSFYTSSLAQVLNYQGVRVATSEDFAVLLGFERQQQLLGCSDDTCRALVTQDLGVDGLLVGQVAKLGSGFSLDVKILEPGSGKPLAAASTTAPDQDRFIASFSEVAGQLAEQLARALGRPLVKGDARVVTRWSTVKRMAWLPLSLGVASVVAGGVALGLSRAQYGELTQEGRSPPLTPEMASSYVQQGKTQQTLGWVGVGVGAALLATAGAMFLLGGDETLSAGVAFMPQGVGFSLAGAW